MKKIIFLFPIFVILVLLFLKIVFNELYSNMIQEDNFLEYTQSAMYFFAFIFAISIAIGFFKSKCDLLGILYLVLSIGFIFVSMEEISWGQRIFNIKPNNFFELYNVQKELNLHNLGIIHYITYGIFALVGFLGAFAWLILPEKIKSSRNSKIYFFVPDWFFALYFFPVFAIYLYYCLSGFVTLLLGVDPFRIEKGSFIVWRDQEPAELLMSLGFLFFMVINKYR